MVRANATRGETGGAQRFPPPRGWSVLVRYLAAASLARLADDGARVALVLLALDRTGSAAFGGLLVAALLVPHVVVAPVVGALADRVVHRRRFHAGALLAFGTTLALCALLVGQVPPVAILAVAILGGCVGPLLTGGMTSMVHDLVPTAERKRAYGLDVVSYAVAGIGGPALTAFAASLFSPGVATLALAVSAGTGALLVASLPLSGRDDPAQPERLVITRGIDVMWRKRPLRAATVASSIGHLGIGGLPLAAALLGSGPADAATAGALLSALAVGALLGSIGYARRPVGAGAPEWVVVTCLAAMAIPFAGAALVSNVVSTALLFGLAGVLTGPLSSALFLVRDREAPADAHAQVFTLGGGLKITAAAVGSGIAGVFAELGGDGLLAGIAACQFLGAASGALLLLSRAPVARKHGDERSG